MYSNIRENFIYIKAYLLSRLLGQYWEIRNSHFYSRPSQTRANDNINQWEMTKLVSTCCGGEVDMKGVSRYVGPYILQHVIIFCNVFFARLRLLLIQ